MSEQFKVNHYKNPGGEKALDFVVNINTTPPNYSSMFENCFTLRFCTQLMSDKSHLCQRNIFSGIYGYYQMMRQFFFVLQFLL